MSRGSFHAAYALPRAGVRADGQLIAGAKGPRLLDYMLCVMEPGDAGYLQNGEAGEFAVVDIITREKALFEQPENIKPEAIGAMIASTFNVSAVRVSQRLWIV